MNVGLTPNSVGQLRNIRETIRREISAYMGQPKDPKKNQYFRHIRFGKTVAVNETYPTTGDTFEVKIGNPTVDNDANGVGHFELTFDDSTYLDSVWVKVCRSLSGNYYPEDSLVVVILIYRKWYILDLKGGRIFRTPSNGIPGRSGTTLGSADCESYSIDGVELVRRKDPDDQDLSETVLHLGTTPVGGSAYIQAKWIDGHWVADMEDCG